MKWWHEVANWIWLAVCVLAGWIMLNLMFEFIGDPSA